MGLVSEDYPKLYHYTSFQSLKGILASQCLWASNYQFLNDTSEFKYAKSHLVPILNDYATEKYSKKPVHFEELFSARIDDAIKGVEQVFNVYILSFCSHVNDSRNISEDGLLSQWRGYGECAIIFDTKALENIMKQEQESHKDSEYRFLDAIYDLENTPDDFNEDLDGIKKRLVDMANFSDINLPHHPYICFEGLFEVLFPCISRLKNPAFKEEREVRLVVSFEKLKPNYRINFRNTLGDLKIPYIKLFDNKNINLPIERIIIGPHPECEKYKADIDSLIKLLKLPSIKITTSEIPYRDR